MQLRSSPTFTRSMPIPTWISGLLGRVHWSVAHWESGLLAPRQVPSGLRGGRHRPGLTPRGPLRASASVASLQCLRRAP
eukprot:484190-Alexandrium_andersonii.AAC.1